MNKEILLKKLQWDYFYQPDEDFINSLDFYKKINPYLYPQTRYYIPENNNFPIVHYSERGFIEKIYFEDVYSQIEIVNNLRKHTHSDSESYISFVIEIKNEGNYSFNLKKEKGLNYYDFSFSKDLSQLLFVSEYYKQKDSCKTPKEIKYDICNDTIEVKFRDYIYSDYYIPLSMVFKKGRIKEIKFPDKMKEVSKWIKENEINPLSITEQEIELFELTFPHLNKKTQVENQKVQFNF